ncbi:MAG: HD domain-containing protein [Planctomycetota bacterium]|jgi:putative nucleotidyltransferase with HDIG domain
MSDENTTRTLKEAESLLDSIAPSNEPWVRHSRQAALIAGKIADALAEAGCDVNPEHVRICALLHDVGRSIDHGYLHGWEGCKILRERGFGLYAKCCVSHWFKGRTKETIVAENINREIAMFEVEIHDEVGADTFELEEKIVALADSMALVDGVVTIENRYDEAEGRYGKSAWIAGNRRISHILMDEIESLLGNRLETLFPELKGGGGV